MVGNNNSTFIQLPSDVTNPMELRRFLDKLVEQLDVAFGNRGDGSFVTNGNFLGGVGSIKDLIDAINREALNYSKIDGSRDYTAFIGYDQDTMDVFNASAADADLAPKKYVDDAITEVFDVLNEPTGYNRQDKTTLPFLELCSTDALKYRQIYYDANDDFMKAREVDTTGTAQEGYFSDGVTQLVTRRFARVPTTNPNGCYYYHKGVKHELTSTAYIDIEFSTGGHIIYTDNGGPLLQKANPTRKEVGDIIEHKVIHSIVTGNSDSGELILLADEMHGHIMDGATHVSKHLTDGCKYGSGMNINGLANNAETYTSIETGDAYDEDIHIEVWQETTESPFWYRDGVGGAWKTTASDNKLGYGVDGTLVYNELVDEATDEWQLTKATSNNDYIIMHFMMSNDLIQPIKQIIGQNYYGSRSDARDNLEGEVSILKMGGLPTPEFIFLYSMIIHDKEDMKIEKGADGEIYVDHRFGSPVKRF